MADNGVPSPLSHHSKTMDEDAAKMRLREEAASRRRKLLNLGERQKRMRNFYSTIEADEAAEASDAREVGTQVFQDNACPVEKGEGLDFLKDLKIRTQLLPSRPPVMQKHSPSLCHTGEPHQYEEEGVGSFSGRLQAISAGKGGKFINRRNLETEGLSQSVEMSNPTTVQGATSMASTAVLTSAGKQRSDISSKSSTKLIRKTDQARRSYDKSMETAINTANFPKHSRELLKAAGLVMLTISFLYYTGEISSCTNSQTGFWMADIIFYALQGELKNIITEGYTAESPTLRFDLAVLWFLLYEVVCIFTYKTVNNIPSALKNVRNFCANLWKGDTWRIQGGNRSTFTSRVHSAFDSLPESDSITEVEGSVKPADAYFEDDGRASASTSADAKCEDEEFNLDKTILGRLISTWGFLELAFRKVQDMCVFLHLCCLGVFFCRMTQLLHKYKVLRLSII